MRDETLADVYASNVTGAQYDAGMKNLMSNKEIIVPLLQLAVPEFKDCSQEEIVRCLVQRILSNRHIDLSDFSYAALSSVAVATATPPSSALHMKKSSCVNIADDG